MKALKVIFGNLHSRIWVIVTAAVLVLAIVCNIVAFNVVNKVFDNLWGGDTSSGRGEGGAYTLDEGITDKASALANANSVNEEICEEGFVLLKNDGLLPMKTDSVPKKVSVFGKNSVNLVYSNSGSAGGNAKGARTIYESLEEAGYEYNPTLKEFYESSASGSGRPASPTIGSGGVTTGFATGETEIGAYDTAGVKDSFSAYADMAIVVISRTCGEASDAPTAMKDDAQADGKVKGAWSADDHYLELDKNEQDMLQMVCEKFENVVLVINSNNNLELGFLDSIADGDETALDYDFASKIKAAIWIGTPGGSGIMALGRILNGTVNPSGKTVDTYARDFTKSPAYQNLAYQTASKTSSAAYLLGTAVQDEYFADYEEGIYVGYRYYETRGAADEEWYKNNVVYPFGYGLSYTDFEWSADLSEVDGAALTKDGTVSVTVNVKNIGDYAGKDVVQLYVRAPYTAGEIEKADKVLVAFGKTDELAAETGEGSVTLTFDAYDFASYDYTDANKNGFTGYEVEAGTYEFFISTDAHTPVLSFTMTAAEDLCFETSVEGGEEVGNLFGDADDQLGSVLTRTDWEGTWPTTPTAEQKTVGYDMLDALKDVSHNNPTDFSQYDYPDSEMDNGMTFRDMLYDPNGAQDAEGNYTDYINPDEEGRPYVALDDERWETLLDQCSISELTHLTYNGAYKVEPIGSINSPRVNCSDGPVGWACFMDKTRFYDTCSYCSQTLVATSFSKQVSYDFGQMVGDEGIIGAAAVDGSPYSGWYAPGANIHRSPFGGRNFEYYSEDGVLSGKMAGQQIQGCMDKGVFCFVKHFAVNEQETHRSITGDSSWLTEQSLREIYLRPFELAVKEGETRAVMSSFNRIGTRWTGGDYRLLTEILRDEWGFQGAVLTDFNTIPAYMNTRQMAYAGGDIDLATDEHTWVDEGSTADLIVLRNNVKNVLYAVVNSNAMNGEVIGYKTPIWQIFFIVLICVLVVGAAVWGFFAIRKALKAPDTSKSE